MHEITYYITLSKCLFKKKKENLKAYLRNWCSETQLQTQNPPHAALVGGKRLRAMSPDGPWDISLRLAGA